MSSILILMRYGIPGFSVIMIILSYNYFKDDSLVDTNCEHTKQKVKEINRYFERKSKNGIILLIGSIVFFILSIIGTIVTKSVVQKVYLTTDPSKRKK